MKFIVVSAVFIVGITRGGAMIVDHILSLNHASTFFRLKRFVEKNDVYLKLEGFNPAGSIKLKTALSMIEGLERRGRIKPGKNKIIESSSGNLGIALSIICKVKGYDFTCVVDPHASPESIKIIELYGGKVITVTEKDEQGGYLNTRIKRIRRIVKEDKSTVWTNQYANKDNPLAHYRTTAREIYEQFPSLDYLFVGTSTTGTLGGCARFFKEHVGHTKVIAVDPVGSVTFGHKAARRLIPGLGASRAPELAALDNVSDVVLVAEEDTIRMCRHLMDRYALFAGPSTATVLHAVRTYTGKIEPHETVVAISPDFGGKYIDTVYNPHWVDDNYQMIIP